jgi:hypothetical protein
MRPRRMQADIWIPALTPCFQESMSSQLLAVITYQVKAAGTCGR